MIDLGCAIISLRFANLTITAEYLVDNNICFHLNGRPHIYDLSSGVIVEENWEMSGCGMEKVITERLKDHYLDPSFYERMNDHDRACMYCDITRAQYNPKIIYLSTLSFILTLASRQVKGDELIKGLKAANYRTPEGFKATKLFTGGWKLECLKGDAMVTYSVEQFANFFDKQFDN